MRLASHECRWFIDGGIGEEDLLRAFRAAGSWTRPVPLEPDPMPTRWRHDVYALLPGHDDMGIKWRDETRDGKRRIRLEFKGRTEIVGDLALAPGCVGRVERWTKWSYDGATAPRALRQVFASDEAGLVHAFKRRVTRKIRLDAFGNDEEVPPGGEGSFVDRGLQFELTRVHLDAEDVADARRQAWTLGFEAFPIDTEMHEAFARNVGAFLQDFGTHRLEPARSMSYPAWLGHATRAGS